MLSFLELIWVHLCIFIIKEKISQFLVKDQYKEWMVLHLQQKHYLISFTQSGKRFVLSLHYNGSNSFLFVNAAKVYQFKAKDSEKKIMHYVWVMFKIWKTGLKRVAIFFLLTLILLIILIFLIFINIWWKENDIKCLG